MCTKRAARNLSYQGFMETEGDPSIVADLVGQDILGVALSAPLAHHKTIYTLPMLTIKVLIMNYDQDENSNESFKMFIF